MRLDWGWDKHTYFLSPCKEQSFLPASTYETFWPSGTEEGPKSIYLICSLVQGYLQPFSEKKSFITQQLVSSFLTDLPIAVPF